MRAMRSFAALAAALVGLSAFLVAAPPAAARPVNGQLCHPVSTSRMVVADTFPLEVCFTGSNLVVKNTLDLLIRVLPLTAAGPTKPPGGWTRQPDTFDGLAHAAAAMDPDPSVLPPDYQVTIPISSAAQSSGSTEPTTRTPSSGSNSSRTSTPRTRGATTPR